MVALLPLLVTCGGGAGGTLNLDLSLTQQADPGILKGDDSILVKISAPGFQEKSYSFSRNSGQGSISGVPLARDIVIKADEYDSLGDLVARGFTYGVNMERGGEKAVSLELVPKGWVITIAGGKGAGDSPDGTYARDALLSGPTEVEYINGLGLFYLDANNFKIKKLDNYWKIKNLVGNGEQGVVLENTDASQTPLENPSSMAVDRDGTIYFSVFIENKIYLVNNGFVERFGGNGTQGYANDQSIAIDSPIYRPKYISYIFKKGLYFVESTNGAVRYINNGKISDNLDLSISGLGSQGFNGKDLIFSAPDKNTIFMIDDVNKKVTQYGDLGYFDTWIGFSDSVLYKGCVYGYFPHKLFLCGDSSNSNIYKIEYDSSGIAISTNNYISGNNSSSILQPLPPDSAGLINPRDVTVDEEGNLYIADTGNNAIRMVVGGGL